VPVGNGFIIPASAFTDAHNQNPMADAGGVPPSVTSPAGLAEWMRRQQRRRQRMGGSSQGRAARKLPFVPGTYYGFLQLQESQQMSAKVIPAAPPLPVQTSRSAAPVEDNGPTRSTATDGAHQTGMLNPDLYPDKSEDADSDPVYILPLSPFSPKF